MTRAGDLLDPDAYGVVIEPRADRIRRDVLVELGCQVLDIPDLVALIGYNTEDVKNAVAMLCADGVITRVEGGWTVMPW